MSVSAPLEVNDPILLYDGTCGFCARSVRFILRHEGERHDLRFAALQGATGRRILDRAGLTKGNSMAWCEGGLMWLRSDAVLKAARYLGGHWAEVATFTEKLPRSARDSAYRLLAAHRHLLGGSSCLIVTGAVRSRFLDLED